MNYRSWKNASLFKIYFAWDYVRVLFEPGSGAFPDAWRVLRLLNTQRPWVIVSIFSISKSPCNRRLDSYRPQNNSHFPQGALAPGKCAALIALELGELVVQFCQAPRIGIIRQKRELFKQRGPGATALSPEASRAASRASASLNPKAACSAACGGRETPSGSIKITMAWQSASALAVMLESFAGYANRGLRPVRGRGTGGERPPPIRRHEPSSLARKSCSK